MESKKSLIKKRLKQLSLSDLNFIIERFAPEAILDWKYGKDNKFLYETAHDIIVERISFLNDDK